MAKVTDPVCGMVIESDSAAGVSTWEGREYFFCSTDCKQHFDAEPADYATGKKHRAMDDAGQEMSDEPRFTEKMGFTAPKFGSAGSGGAEYEPGPSQAGKK